MVGMESALGLGLELIWASGTKSESVVCVAEVIGMRMMSGMMRMMISFRNQSIHRVWSHTYGCRSGVRSRCGCRLVMGMRMGMGMGEKVDMSGSGRRNGSVLQLLYLDLDMGLHLKVRLPAQRPPLCLSRFSSFSPGKVWYMMDGGSNGIWEVGRGSLGIVSMAVLRFGTSKGELESGLGGVGLGPANRFVGPLISASPHLSSFRFLRKGCVWLR